MRYVSLITISLGGWVFVNIWVQLIKRLPVDFKGLTVKAVTKNGVEVVQI